VTLALIFGLCLTAALIAGMHYTSHLKNLAHEYGAVIEAADKAFALNFVKKMTALNVLAKSCEGQGGDNVPRVVVKGFALQAQLIANVVNASFVSFIPVVEKADRIQWEAYVNTVAPEYSVETTGKRRLQVQQGDLVPSALDDLTNMTSTFLNGTVPETNRTNGTVVNGTLSEAINATQNMTHVLENG
jgi:hypothetical protein